MSSDSSCETYLDPLRIYGYRMITSISLSIVFSFLKRRKGDCFSQKSCFSNWGGYIVPVKFLEDKHNRLPVLATFSLIAKDVYVLLFIFPFDEIMPTNEPYQKILNRILSIQLLSFIYLPILVASTTSKAIVIHFFGLVYSIFFIVTDFLSYFPWCPTYIHPSMNDFTGALFFGINITSCFILILDFLYKIYTRHLRSGRIKTDFLIGIPHYHWRYVYRLINCPFIRLDESPLTFIEKLRELFKNYIYWNIPGFRYSVTILVSTYVGVLAVSLTAVTYYIKGLKLYEINTSAIYTVFHTLNIQPKSSATHAAMFLASNLFSANPDRMARILAIHISWIDLVQAVCRLFLFSYWVCIVLAYLLTLVTVLHMLKHYRRGVIDMSKQIRNEHLLNLNKTSNITIMVSATQFAGYQVAHLIWGFHLQLLVFLLLSLSFGLLIFIPLHFAFDEFIMLLVESLGEAKF